MLIDIEQFPGIYSSIPMNCLQTCTFIGKWFVSDAQTKALYREGQYNLLEHLEFYSML